MIAELMESLLAGDIADPARLEEALNHIMLGDVPPAQTAGLLVALRIRQPDASTLAACARAMRAHRLAVQSEVQPLIDTCGTGGDKSGTFNISTAAALVVAAAGGAVAKHGNRSVSSKSGSADVLEACGARLEMAAAEARTLLDSTGFCFLFAPVFHPAMANVAPVRRALAIRTLFNLLGPLTNPALAHRQLLGVYDPAMTKVMAEALRDLGAERALVVHCDGLDEIGLHAPTEGHALRDGKVSPIRMEPEEFGLQRAPIGALVGGDSSENAKILIAILEGEESPRADVVAFNAGAALELAGLAKDTIDGIEQARAALKDSSAARVLARYVESSQRLSAQASSSAS